MSERGQYGRRSIPYPRRGRVDIGAFYHAVSDRADAVRQMAIDWTALYQNLASQAGELIADPKSASGYRVMTQREWDADPPDTKKVLWWKSYAKPIINNWLAFKREQLGVSTHASDYLAFAERWQTDWDVYENWKKKLDDLREEALRQGFSITAPIPGKLSTTVWEDVSKGAKDVAKGAGDAWTFVKYAAWVSLGLGTVVAISSVVQSMRAGKNPADPYLQAIRRSGRSAARAVVPPPVRLALPSEDS